MEIRSIFDRVTRRRAMHANEFLDAYNDVVMGLCARFGDKYVLLDGAVRTDAGSIDSPDSVLDIYAPAIVDGIIWRTSGDENAHALHDSEAVNAYKTVHMTRAYGKVFNIRRTNEPYPVIRGAEEGEINVPRNDLSE